MLKQPRTNDTARWISRRVVVEVKFDKWTTDGKLRQPIFLGIASDKDPTSVRRERLSAGVKPTTWRPSASPSEPQAPLASDCVMSVFWST